MTIGVSNSVLRDIPAHASDSDFGEGLDTFIVDIAKGFHLGVTSLGSALDAALQALQQSPSDPSALASYQAILSEYTMYRNAQSSAVKAMKDIDSDIASKLR
ncbi:type III secretion system needle filament subunit SctF [Xanthomonas phaseoli pv. phaseoli]|uniref:Protein prgI (Modular protein) n=1 Tax=Xanthomonas campestris pv. phaseoli TaxID=317013 RepID=A0AB38DTX6_XANCH|nr:MULTISPECIES: type III secretion system needle filament subunit SctF [Xanthomonas]ATS23154.1 type III secretion system needle filament subunit SctF [Xanthomonas phaseoli pv. phaseoli]ATS26051.1 type III secretion system needle filament subunit SctF [Xanthomonas phaseoli pv. phaseoli]ATS30457.1 type III secretion system needle filament subunit SctF [Xanthomonas phaseoli pv. phaseoli]ATS34310.1 type III secretion system needle filament subunit SctF [Xanthomonas phaseoli pv. phaseoli]MBO973713